MKQLFFIALTSAFLFSSCKKDSTQEYNPAVKAGLSVEFDNIAGAADFQLNTGIYTNAAGEQFNVTSLKYYVSNFTLTNADGTVFTVPQDSCYFLIDESDEETHEPVLKVPEGEYKTISFTVGIDSARNIAPASERLGVLDTTATGMYKSWNNGYTFFKMEGTSSAITTGSGGFMYSVSGFGHLTPNNLKTITLDLTSRGTPKVKANKETNIHLMVDILKALNGNNNLSLAATPTIDDALSAMPLANNYVQMFRHDHTEN